MITIVDAENKELHTAQGNFDIPLITVTNKDAGDATVILTILKGDLLINVFQNPVVINPGNTAYFDDGLILNDREVLYLESDVEVHVKVNGHYK